MESNQNSNIKMFQTQNEPWTDILVETCGTAHELQKNATHEPVGYDINRKIELHQQNKRKCEDK